MKREYSRLSPRFLVWAMGRIRANEVMEKKERKKIYLMWLPSSCTSVTTVFSSVPLLTPWRTWCQMNMQRLYLAVLCDNPTHRKFLHLPSPLLAVLSHDAAYLSDQERWEAVEQRLMKILTKTWSILLHGDGKTSCSKYFITLCEHCIALAYTKLSIHTCIIMKCHSGL